MGLVLRCPGVILIRLSSDPSRHPPANQSVVVR